MSNDTASQSQSQRAVRRRPVVVEFEDRFGETQVIHRAQGKLKIRRKSPTVILAMTASIGRYIGQRVREERLKAGVTMPELAERSGLKGGKQAIYHVENAMETGVRIGTVYAIAAALDVSPFSLLPPVEMVLRESAVAMATSQRLVV